MQQKSKRNLYVILIKSFVTAALFTVFCYFVTNLGYSIAGEKTLVSKINKKIKDWGNSKTDVPDSVLLVNISYDKELAPINDADGFPMGDIDITNREALYTFLEILEQRNDYKYVMIDVFFADGIESPSDSALFNKIASMPRVVIPRHRDAKLAHDSLLHNKAYISDYIVTNTSSGFGKYELIAEGDTSIALHMYKELTGHDVKKKGLLFYFDNGRLCNSTLFSRQAINFSSPYNADGEKNFYNLSADLLMDTEDLLTTPLLKNKYIFVGAMEMVDIHSTAEGKLPGVVITANAFLGTMNGQHLVPILMIFIIFSILFIISYQVYSGKTIAKWMTNKMEKMKIKTNPILWAYLLSWVSYMSILSFVGIISYLIYGVIYDIFFTATLFQWIDYLINNWSFIRNPSWKYIKDKVLEFTVSKL